jgi:nucleotide-binding universal stress UspA family protein
LSVYDYPLVDTSALPPELAVRHREDLLRRTDTLMVAKLDAYVASLHAAGVAVSPVLRVGDPGAIIVEAATNLKADLLILGSHSKRGLWDIVLGGTAQQVSKAAPYLVVLVSPRPQGSG